MKIILNQDDLVEIVQQHIQTVLHNTEDYRITMAFKDNNRSVKELSTEIEVVTAPKQLAFEFAKEEPVVSASEVVHDESEEPDSEVLATNNTNATKSLFD